MIAEQEKQEVAQPWQPPIVRVGQPVIFYRYGERNPKHANVAYVLDYKGRTCKVRTIDGRTYGSVKHVDDPTLIESADQRQDNGGWDYTEEERRDRQWDKSVGERLSELERRTAALAAAIASMEAKKKG